MRHHLVGEYRRIFGEQRERASSRQHHSYPNVIGFMSYSESY